MCKGCALKLDQDLTAALTGAVTCAPNSDGGWPDIVKAGLPLVVTLVIGGLAAWIANGQRKIAAGQLLISQGQRDIASAQKDVAAAKLRLDLFDRRLEVFNVIWAHLSRDPKTSWPYSQLTNLAPKAQFLFGTPIRDYLMEVHGKLVMLDHIQGLAESNGKVVPPNKVEDNYALTLWILTEATEGCRSRFAEYLDFSAWRGAPASPPTTAE